MTLRQRDKKALWILAGAVVLILIARFSISEDAHSQVVAPSDTVSVAESRLSRLRRRVAALPAAEKALQAAVAERSQREKGIIQAETAAQAQAQVLQVLRRVAAAQAPPIEVRTVEMGQVHSLGDYYGEIALPVVFECRVEQLLNLLADLTAQPEVLATSELRVSVANLQEKTMQVRLTVAGVAPRQLVPEKKGAAF